MCEAFGIGPSQAIAELERDPGLVFAVMESAHYGRLYRQIRDAKNAADHPDLTDPLVEIIYRTIAAKQAGR